MSHSPSAPSKPNYLFLIGAPKCGTTSVASWLGERSQVTTPRIKEPCYFTDFAQHDWTGPGIQHFAQPWLSDWDAYDALFENHASKWRVDASTDYLWCESTPERLARFAQEHRVKLAVILRDPVSRAISEYQHTQRDGFSSESLARSLDLEEERKAQRMHPLFYHVTRSRYSAPLRRYRALFGDNLLILDYHVLESERRRLLNFLGIEEHGESESLQRQNEGRLYRSPVLRRLIKGGRGAHIARRIVPKQFRAPIRRKITKMATTSFTPSAADIARLRAALADEIAACEASTDIPTRHWAVARQKTT